MGNYRKPLDTVNKLTNKSLNKPLQNINFYKSVMGVTAPFASPNAQPYFPFSLGTICLVYIKLLQTALE